MDNLRINKTVINNNQIQKIDISNIDDVWDFRLYTREKEYLYNRVIEIDDVTSTLPYLPGTKLYFMIKAAHYEIINEMFCYQIDSFIVSNNSFSENFYKKIEEITFGSFERKVKTLFPTKTVEIDEVEDGNLINFKNSDFYLPLNKEYSNVYKSYSIRKKGAIEYERSSRAFECLINGGTYKDDMVIYMVDDISYYKFTCKTLNTKQAIYNGCISYTNFSYDEFHKKYLEQVYKEITDEFIHFGLTEKQGRLPERKLIFLRQVEYIIYFFKEDTALNTMLEKYNIEENVNSMSNLNLIKHVLYFYNNGEYDNGLFAKFNSFINVIDEQIIDHIANQIIKLRNGIAHFNEGSLNNVNYQYFDLISEIAYLMYLRYIGVVFNNKNAPTLHAGTIVPIKLNLKKRNVEVKAVENKQPVIQAKEKKVTKVKKTTVNKKDKYNFFAHGYLEKLNKQSYTVKNQSILEDVNHMIRSQQIAIELDGNVKLDNKMLKLVSNNADIIYSNSNKKYKDVINKNQDKMIVFTNRKEIIIPKKHLNKYTHKKKKSQK
ncbi:hypothetical protein R2F61_02590 [Mollicutes bacterium LVI A0078]|nr:hypothetical protein RZE84_02620 [Mollicutes bacterium LVI A0075]WOO91458.1 hypothetical protein R2F61_02590 [Mollicutes bacterium LVI A0078]